jgi:hypothetical protein
VIMIHDRTTISIVLIPQVVQAKDNQHTKRKETNWFCGIIPTMR